MSKYMKLFILFNLYLSSGFLFSDSCRDNYTDSYVESAIQDFPGSVGRVLLSEYDLEKVRKVVEKNDFSYEIADWTGGYETGVKACIAKFRYQSALNCQDKTPDEQSKIIKQAQEDTRACVTKFKEYKKSFQAWNFGDTQMGADFLERQANKRFKP